MARLRLYPHRTAAPGCVSWYSWWTERDGDRSPLSAVLAGWDYASRETMGITVSLDEEALLESTGLESISDLEILAMADSPLVQQRFVAREPLRGHDSRMLIDVAIQLPPGQVAGAVRLSAHLVLAHTTQERADRVAFFRGARIDSSEPFTVRFEGDSGRFPTEPAPFSELGFGNAPWTVLTFYDELSDSFLGGVRLLVNTEHPVGQLALDPKTTPQVSSLLRAEVMRLLIAKVAGQVEDADESSFEDGSVGQVLETMCQEFLGRRLRTTARLYRDDPAHFELLLHDRLDPLAGMTA